MAREIKSGWFDSQDVMAELGVDQRMVKERVKKILKRQDQMELADVRKAAAITQTDLAKRLNVSQNRVSQIELANLHTTQVDTLRNYIEALGGDLIIGAVIDGEVVLIHEAPPK